MGTYIDQAYLTEVVGQQLLLSVLSNRFGAKSMINLNDPGTVAAIDRAIAVAEGTAEAKLGRRFSPAELDALASSDAEVIKHAIARIAIHTLAPSSMPRSEEIRADMDRASGTLKAIAKREMAAGREDPDPPPDLSETVCTVRAQGLDGLGAL